MADLIDNAAGEMQQVSSQLTRAGVRTSMTVAAGTTRVSARLGVRAVGGAVKALLALLDTVRQASPLRVGEGEIRLREFTRVAEGKREILPIKDAEVARQLSRELRRHGVTYAMERHDDDSRTFHVQGKDAALIEHALNAAAIKVDERIAKKGARDVDDDPTLTQEVGTRVLTLDDPQKTTLAGTLRESAQGQHDTAPESLAAHVENSGQVTLTESNVEMIDAALSGTHELPPHMSSVAAVIDEEKVAIAVTDRDEPSHAAVRSAPQSDMTQGESLSITTVIESEETANDIEQDLGRPPGRDITQVWDKEMGQRGRSTRDATRERVAHRVKVKVDEIKQQGGDAGARAIKRTHGDDPQLPISRR